MDTEENQSEKRSKGPPWGKELDRKLVLAIYSIIPLFLGTVWSLNFIFTDYRKHLAPIGIPLGLVMLTVGISLIYPLISYVFDGLYRIFRRNRPSS
jgi:hypothetical protein